MITSHGKWQVFKIAIIVTILNTILTSIAVSVAYLVFFKEKKDRYLQFLKEDGKIYTGVLVSNDLLTGIEKEDIKRARVFLTDKEDNLWKFIRTEDDPLGYQYRLFIFQALPLDERLPLD